MRHHHGSVLIAITCVMFAGCALRPSSPATLQWANLEHERLIVVTLRSDRPMHTPRAGSTVRSYRGAGSYSVAPTVIAQARSLASSYKLREVSGWPIALLGVHCVVYAIDPGADRETLLERLRRDRRVESAQPMNSFETLASGTNDPYRTLQRNLDAMNVGAAHRWSRGEGVRIGIVDTGIDVAHPELKGRIAGYRDFVSSTRTITPERHGTAVAGIIGAADDNALGIVGVAPASELYAFRACWHEPARAEAYCNTLTLAKALVAALENAVDIVNLSLGGPADPLLTRLVNATLERGIIVVGAAPQRAEQRFPTSIAGVVTVDAEGASSSADATLYAPGQDVLTLAPNGSYEFLSGSSLAAASVSGGIALMLARQPKLTSAQIRSLLNPTDASRSDDASAARSIDLCAAVTRLGGGSCD